MLGANDEFSIICISDTEINAQQIDEYLPKMALYIKNARTFVHLGDGISSFKQAVKSTELFASKEIIYIRGNHDRDTCYKKLPEQQQIIVDKNRIFFYHGQSFNRIFEHIDVVKNKIRLKIKKPMDLSWYYKNQQQNLNGKYEIVIYGHIHIPRIEKIGSTIYFCPGGFTYKSMSSNKGNLISFGEVKILKSKGQISFNLYEFINSNFKLIDSKTYDYSS
ncbi:hypothetical protein A2713_00305 [candidate division WWE3 bacterium RIFCSPHIGHO2_01_FULL_35_17]|uniref:Calcineurin-like phosphoesterase domain-containing protein n=1 Tax=candidate division WWE3 bacterium RIFCSPHIGHO2_01_FULL_35_17 TaxID=1802614 RepID=A0A1F4URV5_UNCKA|nr:MAG: hypothetical protein A2713_00305 [candidate division WWE3 bacterium RIFCSPHIGHO2_01_FULL_35_17]